MAEPPLIIRRIISFLDSNPKFLEEEGIFRLAGSTKEVTEMKRRFQQGEGDRIEFKNYDSNSVCDLLKRFIREIPDFLPASATSSLETHDLEKVKSGIVSLPDGTQAVFREVLRILNQVENRHDLNKMSSQNLAIVFAPNFGISFAATEFVITNFSHLF
eukprot:TRINITY_DN14535_c0_g1_i1.p1 TRINITY_DN14535_c0_g1~~TRINITY_DN14535_c0_g1_i1.p1  ORF type:complete len:175 (+),score=40.26 TRINITY_DN14535_c0_g1_i1:50-526(+)